MATGTWKEQTWSAIHTPALASAGVAYQSRFFEALQNSIKILFWHISIDLSWRNTAQRCVWQRKHNYNARNSGKCWESTDSRTPLLPPRTIVVPELLLFPETSWIHWWHEPAIIYRSYILHDTSYIDHTYSRSMILLPNQLSQKGVAQRINVLLTNLTSCVWQERNKKRHVHQFLSLSRHRLSLDLIFSDLQC